MGAQDEAAKTLRVEGGRPASGLSLRVVGEGVFLTCALPADGDVVIGRSSGADVKVDDPSISRQHAVLHLGAVITVEDLGSANGTRVGDRVCAVGERVEVKPGEVIDIGSVMVVVQPRAAAPRLRRIWTHGYFEGRLEEECARAARTATGGFAVVRIRLSGGAPPEGVEQTIAGALREADTLASYGPGELEALLPETSPAEADAVVTAMRAELVARGVPLAAAIACWPRDGRAADELIDKAARRLAGGGDGESPRPAPGSLVVEDPAMQRLHKMVDRIAAGTISVLLLGETGVGKEIVAEAIHRASRRAMKPFLRLNCAALTETLLESELFGYEKGAFTGAAAPKPGLFETADGGTVFLDEIGELPAGLQAKLLRVIEDKKVMRVGALKPKEIDVRFIAATNRDLERHVADGGFRQDLFFRLNGFSLVIPPLRDRRREIAPLARSFLAGAAKAAGRGTPPSISPAAMSLLERYAWPGNIRELKNVIERAVLLCTGAAIEPEHLPGEKLAAATVAPPSASRPVLDPPSGSIAARVREGTTASTPARLKNEIETLERQRILGALEACGGNQTQAAKALGISRGTLLSRLEAYGLPRPRKKTD